MMMFDGRNVVVREERTKGRFGLAGELVFNNYR